MRTKHVVCGLVVIALVGGFSSRALAEFFPWWAFDSVIEEVQDRGRYAPDSACSSPGRRVMPTVS